MRGSTEPHPWAWRSRGRGLNATRSLGEDGLVLLESPRHQAGRDPPLNGVRGFRHVEPDFALWADGTVDDTYFVRVGAGQQRPVRRNRRRRHQRPEAWNDARGDDSVAVGVIDSGVDYAHPDLADNT